MRFFQWYLILAVCLAMSLAQTSPAFAQKRKGKTDLKLPTDPAAWINAPPLSLEALKGKCAVLWFYEEGCPSCRKLWPDMLKSAEQFNDKPVLFIAVNSGNPRGEVEQYAREAGIKWPIIVDTDRSFEKSAGVPTVGLDNIYQPRVILPNGELKRVASTIEECAKTALTGAAWKVDPAGMPPAMRPVWLGVEFGNYSQAGPMIKKYLNSPQTKEFATKLSEAVREQIDGDIAEAKDALADGNKWAAFKALSVLPQRYPGFDLPPDVLKNRKELMADADVKAAMLAAKNLELAKQAAATPNEAAHKRAIMMLQKIVKDVPGTDLATEAQSLLDLAGAQ